MHNVEVMMFYYEGFSLFAIAGFIYFAYFAVKMKKSEYTIPLATFLLYSAGYTIYHIEDRYIWFGAVLLMLMTASMRVKKIFLIIILFSFLLIPTKR